MQDLPFTLREFANEDWLIAVILGSFLLLAIARRWFPDRSTAFIQLPVSNKYFLVQGRASELNHPFTLLLWLVTIVNLSLFVYLFISPSLSLVTSHDFLLFVQIFALVLGLVLVKFFIEKLIGTVFDIEQTLNQYLFEKVSYLNLISLIFLIANIVYLWGYHESKMVLWSGLGLGVIGLLLSLFYSYKTNEKLIFSNFFYFILYLCALEISPYLIVYKAFL